MGIFQAISDVWTDVSEWLILHFSMIQEIFWTTTEGGNGSLTFMGILAVIALGISIFLLVMSIIKSFLRLS